MCRGVVSFPSCSTHPSRAAASPKLHFLLSCICSVRRSSSPESAPSTRSRSSQRTSQHSDRSRHSLYPPPIVERTAQTRASAQLDMKESRRGETSSGTSSGTLCAGDTAAAEVCVSDVLVEEETQLYNVSM